MSLSDLAPLGSFVSGVAVLISLIYLSLQVRQAAGPRPAARAFRAWRRCTAARIRTVPPILRRIADTVTTVEAPPRLARARVHELAERSLDPDG
jgi:hypothetical protein